MKPLDQLSLYAFSDVLKRMEHLYESDPQLYEDFLGEVCAEFPLVRDYVLAIEHMASQGADKRAIQQADLNMRHLMALWIMTEEKDLPVSTESGPY
ncbi:hypothetical protein [Desulfoplanes formicivorans]|uniref:Uncharacterized protein n=1 Tax=Desulfoplanes formicivorans TaxID=1592317 RepID=A0A194AJC0_9BACT|nr:hypothetical protein [Desulfoplanes formicivorans]GAU09335.1 hypothetical protein DPF_2058 [Desulfoplanes formicivorans]